jgi:hypothetical protein
MNPGASPGHSGEHTFIGGRSRSPGRDPAHGATVRSSGAAQSRGSHLGIIGPPTSSCHSRAGRDGSRRSPVRPVEAPRPRRAARRPVGQLSLAAVASVHRSSSARSAWILR